LEVIMSRRFAVAPKAAVALDDRTRMTDASEPGRRSAKPRWKFAASEMDDTAAATSVIDPEQVEHGAVGARFARIEAKLGGRLDLKLQVNGVRRRRNEAHIVEVRAIGGQLVAERSGVGDRSGIDYAEREGLPDRTA